jgi:hypothetical protein
VNVDTLSAHLHEVSAFEISGRAGILILGADLVLSLLHSLQEWKGSKAPLWRVFGAIVGVWVPHPLGFAVFTVGLTVLLWTAGLTGIAGWLPGLGPVPLCWTIVGLGFLIGARVADSVVSHWLPYGVGYRPNPGLSSTPLYVVEAIFLGVTFWKGLSRESGAAWAGFVGGWLFFCVVLPLLAGLRALAPSWRRERWRRWTPLPPWTKP